MFAPHFWGRCAGRDDPTGIPGVVPLSIAGTNDSNLRVGRWSVMAFVTVTVAQSDSELEKFQAVQRIAVLIGGEVGQAISDALVPYTGEVCDRAVGHDS